MRQPFVVSRKNNKGVGKLISRSGNSGIVEYFRSPVESEPFQESLPLSSLERKILSAQTRIYWQNQDNDIWMVGRVLDYQKDDDLYFIQFPNDERKLIPSDDLKVRCSDSLVDPTEHLAYQLNETAFWNSLRSDFVRHLLEQRRSNLGMTALVSSSVELVAHQISVIHRILLDPFQRYLLADEVGLGKTIEAGVLIKQFSLDHPDDHETLVIVPESLMVQWQQELQHRFHLGDKMGKSIFIASSSDQEQIRKHISTAKMVVIDEAHHLCSWAWSAKPAEFETFEIVRKAVNDIGMRLLLLSATPVLHNEKAFLAMLHLLDPQVYSLESLDSFKERVQKRQVIAESMLSLTESESNYFISDAIEALGEHLTADREFQSLREKLARLLDQDVAEEDPERNALIYAIRTHVSDVWQLHRRIIRNRRSDKTSVYLPGRGGATCVEYDCEGEEELCEVLEAWRLNLSTSCFSASEEMKRLADELVKTAEELAATEPRGLIDWTRNRLKNPVDLGRGLPLCEGETDHLNRIIRVAKQCDHSAKLQKLLKWIRELDGNHSCLVFVNSKATADVVFNFLDSHIPYPSGELHLVGFGKFDSC